MKLIGKIVKIKKVKMRAAFLTLFFSSNSEKKERERDEGGL